MNLSHLLPIPVIEPWRTRDTRANHRLPVGGFLWAILCLWMACVPAGGAEKVLPLPGRVFTVAGHTAFVILPGASDRAERPTPWVWYAPTLANLPGRYEKWMFERFLARGIAIAGVDVGESYGSPAGRAVYQAFYRHMVDKQGLSDKPCLLARSRGGLMLYNWAAEHPDCLSGIAGIYPVCNLASYPGLQRACRAYGMTQQQLAEVLEQHNPIDRLIPLAQAGVPIFHLHGDRDTVVPLEENSAELARRYRRLGGPMQLVLVPGQGHNLWPGWFENQALVDFVIACAKPDRPTDAPAVTVGDLRCEYLAEPLGIDTPRPRFSWKMIDRLHRRGQKQTAYQLRVEGLLLEQPDQRRLLWDSGKVMSSESVNMPYAGPPLHSDQVCFWQVRLWDKDGQATAWSRPARFTMGLLSADDWQGRWIGGSGDDNLQHLWFRRNFTLKAKPALAFAHLGSIGYHELYVNGRRIGDRVLSPELTNLTRRVSYVTYDIADALQEGDNVIAVWLGPGWARATGSYGKGVWEQPSLFICQVNLSNGVRLASDHRWRCRPSSSRYLGPWRGGGKGQYGGELIDARLHVPGWNRPDYDDSHWPQAREQDPAWPVVLSASMLEPDRPVQCLFSRTISGQDGRYTIDFGRNFTGWLEVQLRRGRPGQAVTFKMANRRDTDVDFNQESRYIFDDSGSGTFRHRFNYTAGRWLTIEGLADRPSFHDVRAHLITNDRRRIGFFRCSNELLNRIYETDLRTYIANTVNGVVMDCPHRERFGYGEVALACSWGCGLPNYESAAFYTKNLRDWIDVQREDGFINTIAPQVYRGAGGTLWSSGLVTLAWECYKNYGDRRLLERAYRPIKKWLDYLHRSVNPDGILAAYESPSRFLGDWATPHGSEYGNTPPAQLFNNCVYAYDLQVFVRMARLLGRTDDVKTYSDRLQALRKNVHRHFYDPRTGLYLDGRQLATVFPLYTGICPPERRRQCFDHFVRLITGDKPYLDTGSSGLPILLKYIVEHAQRADLLYPCLTRTEPPGYGYFLANGQTTWPEYWQITGHASRIHTCYTGIAGYFIKAIGGIRPDPDHGGMQQFIIQPHLVGDLTFAQAQSASLYGTIRCHWSRRQHTARFFFEIPPNSSARLYIPARQPQDVTENGRPAAQSPGLTCLGRHDRWIVFHAQAGRYHLVSSSAPPPHGPAAPNPRRPDSPSGDAIGKETGHD